MDAEIAARSGSAAYLFESHGRLLSRLVAEGDELGLHVHALRTDAAGDWYNEHEDAAWIRQCTRAAARAFAAASGRPARSFRFGDRFLSNAMIAELPGLGVRYDLTLESGQKAAPRMVSAERATGSLPDFSAACRNPYRPTRRDYLSPARHWWQARRLWMVPITTGCVNGAPLPARVGDEHDIVHLNLALRGDWVGIILDAVLAAGQPVVASVARTGDLVSAASRRDFVENLGRLAEHPLLTGRVFTNAAEAVAIYRRGAGARGARAGASASSQVSET
jgi:hypothetical protein